MTLKIVKPVVVTPAMLQTSVPEDDHPAWDVGTTYADGVRMIDGHMVWQSLQAANTGKAPASNPAWWVDVGPTNRWKAFDLSHSTQTEFANSAWFEISAGQATGSIALLEMNGVRSVRVVVTDPIFGVVYDTTKELYSIPEESNWYAWFFGDRTEQRNFYALDLPNYPSAVIRLDMTGAASAAIGVIIVGSIKSIGKGVLSGVRLGIRDYSRKEVNQWGDVVLQQRAFARTRSLQVLIENIELDNIDRTLAGLRATPVLWLISDNLQQANAYGWYSDYDIGIQYVKHSELSLQIESLAF